MAAGYTNAGAFTSLLRVKGGSTQPEGRDGLIWVKTDVQIPYWAISPIQPEAPAEGAVWIKTANTNAFNVLRKNTLDICPNRCSQYIGGKWIALEGFLFRGGKFVQFGYALLYIYNEGAESPDVFGNLILRNAAKNTNHIAIAAENSGTAYTAYAATGNSIDLSNAKKVTAVFDFVHAYSTPRLAIASVKPNLANTSSMIQGILAEASYPSTETGADKTLSLDVTNISAGWIVFGMANTTSARLKQLWIE